MARAFSQVKSSRGKELKCGRCGHVIVAGETYFHFAVGFRGSKQIRCKDHRPRQSELCGNKLSGVYAAIESVEDVLAQTELSIDDIGSALDDAASSVEEVRDEYQESFDSMGDNLQNADTGQQVQEKIDACEEFASQLQQAAEEIRSLEGNDEEDTEEDSPLDQARTIAEDVLGEFSL
jgi:chromosome segregation ATPase